MIPITNAKIRTLEPERYHAWLLSMPGLTTRDWYRVSDDPSPQPGGKLLTPRDAANCITKLPKREHDSRRNGARRSRR
jgi:hypothetical protein